MPLILATAKALATRETLNARARARAIGRELRRRYEDTLHEPVPPDMLDLLRRIDEKLACPPKPNA